MFPRSRFFTVATRETITFCSVFVSQTRLWRNWRDVESLRRYLEQLKIHFQIKDDEWDLITTRQVMDFNGAGLLKRYRTIKNAVRIAFPELNIEELSLERWNDIEFLRKYVEELKEHYAIKDDEWDLISKQQIIDFNGRGLLRRYRTLANALGKLDYTKMPTYTTKEWKDLYFLRYYLEQLQQHYNISDNEWHTVTRKQVVDFGGSGLLNRYKSVKTAVLLVFPNIEFPQKDSVDWSDINHVREYLRKLREHYGISDEEWHSLTRREVKLFNGHGLLKRYGSLSAAVSAAFPNIEVRDRLSQNWKDLEYVREYLQNLRKQLQLTEDEWHLITTKQIIDNNGAGLLNRYGTLKNIMHLAFPEVNYSGPQPRQNWGDKEYVKDYLQRLRVHYQRTEDEWHLISRNQVIEFNGAGLIKRYKTLQNALQTVFPHIETRSFKHWEIRENVAEVFDSIKRNLNITNENDLVHVSNRVMRQYGAGPIIKFYKTKAKALSFAYPHRIFKELQLPPNYWNEENIKAFIKEMETKLIIKQPSDWYRVSQRMLTRFGGQGLCTKTRSMAQVLKSYYPDITWDEQMLARSQKKSEQYLLKNVLSKIYPGLQILEDYLHPKLKFDTGRPIEIDLFVPDINLGVEYQGEHHFEDIPYFGPLEMYQQRDLEKAQKCIDVGIRLIAVPYWWAGSEEDLRERISAVEKK